LKKNLTEIKNLQKNFQEIPEKILKILKKFCITKKIPYSVSIKKQI